MTDDDLTPPPTPRSGPTWSTPPGPPVGPGLQGPYVPSPVAPKKRRPVLTHGAVALVALFIGVGIGGSGGDGSDDGKPAVDAAPPAATSPARALPAPATTEPPETTAPPETAAAAPRPATTKPKPSREPGPPTSFDGDGEYLVGEDIAAGTYKTAGPADFGCYWERDKDSSGEFESIIANDNLNGSGRVTVRKGEIFKTQGCQTWKKVS